MKQGVESANHRWFAVVAAAQDGRGFYPILLLISVVCMLALTDFGGSASQRKDSLEILPSVKLRLQADSPPPASAAIGDSEAHPDRPTSGSSDAAGTAEAESELEKYLARVRAMVARKKRYPPREKNAGKQGVVTVQVMIDGSGVLQSAALVGASPHDGLNDAALRAVHSAAPFPEIPAQVGKNQVTFRLRLNFRL